MTPVLGVSYLADLSIFLYVHVIDSKKGKVHPCTGTEVLYRPYGP